MTSLGIRNDVATSVPSPRRHSTGLARRYRRRPSFRRKEGRAGFGRRRPPTPKLFQGSIFPVVVSTLRTLAICWIGWIGPRAIFHRVTSQWGGTSVESGDKTRRRSRRVARFRFCHRGRGRRRCCRRARDVCRRCPPV